MVTTLYRGSFNTYGLAIFVGKERYDISSVIGQTGFQFDTLDPRLFKYFKDLALKEVTLNVNQGEYGLTVSIEDSCGGIRILGDSKLTRTITTMNVNQEELHRFIKDQNESVEIYKQLEQLFYQTL